MAENRGPQVSGIAGLFLALTTVLVVLRIYCRVVLVKHFGIDDWLAVVAQILYTFFCAFAITGVQYGTGRHLVDIQPPSDIPIGLKWWWACEPVYVLSNMALKFSIGIFLLRITVSKAQRVILWTVMGVTLLMSTYFFFLFVFQCWPISYFWQQYNGLQGSCIDLKIITVSTYAYSSVSCWADWTCCILPAFMVWNLQMNPRTKVSVCILLALSAIASTATIIRIPYVAGLSNIGDFLYATTDVAIWSIAETGLGIMASAGATLRPLFRDFLTRSRLLGGTTKEGSQTWASSRAGNQRIHDNSAHLQEIGLQHDVGKFIGVNTVIESQKTRINEPITNLKISIVEARRDWNASQTKLTEGSSEEFGSISNCAR